MLRSAKALLAEPRTVNAATPAATQLERRDKGIDILRAIRLPDARRGHGQDAATEGVVPQEKLAQADHGEAVGPPTRRGTGLIETSCDRSRQVGDKADHRTFWSFVAS